MADVTLTGEKDEGAGLERKYSFPDDDLLQPVAFMTAANSLEDLIDLDKPEHTHFSEEGIADMDIPDDILDELEYLDNITSCDKVENYLMLSEYEQNLIKEIEGPVFNKRTRKWSLVRQPSSIQQGKIVRIANCKN